MRHPPRFQALTTSGPVTSPRVLAGFLVYLLAIACQSATHAENFRPLFEEGNFDGWVNVNTAPSTWRFDDDGLLICSGIPIGEIRTEKMYQNFILELEWRHMKPRGNAGVFVWADDITARGQPFHRGIEVQVLENSYGNTGRYTTHGDIFPIHGATMTPANNRGRGKRSFPTEFRSKPSPEWNHYRIKCNDGAISLAVNGKVVTEGRECSPRKGYICLESEGGIVHYRNVRIAELPDTPVEEKDVAIANRGYRCLYNGVDFSGWKKPPPGWASRDWILDYKPAEKSDEEGRADKSQTRTLESGEAFRDFGFITDFKLSPESGVPRIRLRNSDVAVIALDPDDPDVGPHLEKPGKWNRLEGELIENKLTLSVNGKPVYAGKFLGELFIEGPLVLEPEGPVQWANIYVRPLEEQEKN